MDNEVTLLEKFERQLDDAPWRQLREHAARDGLICCAFGVDILEAAIAVAEDNTDWVAEAIATGKLFKPTAERLGKLEAQPETLFRFLIVQPFVLVQELDA